MAKPQLLQGRYTRMVQDLQPSQLPPGAMVDIRDGFPNRHVPTSTTGTGVAFPGDTAFVRRRGGWAAVSTGGTLNKALKSIKWAVSSTGTERLFGVDENGVGWGLSRVGGTSTSLTGTANPSGQIVYFNDLFIMPVDPDGVGAATVQKWDGGAAVAVLGGTPPAGKYATVHKSRLVLANKTGAVTTVYFSAVQDPATWDVDSFITTTYPVRGLASLGNSLFVFSDGKVEVIRGSTPPTSTGTGSVGDMTLDGLHDQGCIDARSIVVHDNRVTWANKDGIWSSDGSAIENVTAVGGMSSMWRDAMTYWNLSTRPISAGLCKGYYIISVREDFTFAVDLSTRAFVRLKNVESNCYSTTTRSDGETYFAPRLGTGESGYAAKLSGIFGPIGGGGAIDGNGNAVEMMLKFPFWEGSPGSRRWKDVYVDLSAVGPDSGSYVKFSRTSLASTVTYLDIADDDGTLLKYGTSTIRGPVKVPIRRARSGIGLQLTQVGNMQDLFVGGVSATVFEREASRGATLGTTA